MYENTGTPISLSPHSIYHYETVPPSSSLRPLYENSNQQPYYISFESISPYQTTTIPKDKSLTTPPFQKKLPSIPVAILGVSELIGGLIVLVLELIVFDIAVGVWCGFIYALAGAAAIVLVTGTDCERHQTSAVLIFQFVALMFTITEIILHTEIYQKRCTTKPSEPTRETSVQCQILLTQIAGASLVLISTLIFAIIYFRVTIAVLKQPHGTFNMSNALNLSSC